MTEVAFITLHAGTSGMVFATNRTEIGDQLEVCVAGELCGRIKLLAHRIEVNEAALLSFTAPTLVYPEQARQMKSRTS